MAGASPCDSKSFFRSQKKCLGESSIGVDVGKFKHVAGFLSRTLLERHEHFEGCPTFSFEQSREGFRAFVDADYPKGWPQPTESLATWENWPVEPYEQQKRRSFAGVYLASAKPRKLACRADSPAFSCVANLLVGNGQTFG